MNRLGKRAAFCNVINAVNCAGTCRLINGMQISDFGAVGQLPLGAIVTGEQSATITATNNNHAPRLAVVATRCLADQAAILEGLVTAKATNDDGAIARGDRCLF